MGYIQNIPNSLTNNGGFIGASIDLDRPAEVILIKKVKIDYEQSIEDANKSFQSEYSEFFNKGIPEPNIAETLGNTLIRNNNEKAIRIEVLTKAVPITQSKKYNKLGESIVGYGFQRTGVFLSNNGYKEDTESSADYEIIVNTKYRYIYILPAIDITRENYIITSRNNSALGISDITDITVTIGTSSFSTANLSVKNNLNKYEFITDSLKKGKTIFSADDIVVVRLPGIDYQMTDKDLHEGLETSFVGFVNDIRLIDKPAGHVVNINCEGMTKRLRFTRVLTNQALNPGDAQAAIMPISAFSFPFHDKTADASYLVKNMMVYSMTDINENIELKPKINEFNLEYEKYNSYDDNEYKNNSQANAEIVANLRKKIEELKEKKREEYFKDVQNEKDTRIYNNEKTLAPIKNGFKIPICMVTGTTQKAYKLLFAKWQMWIAEWQQANKLIQDIANTVNFMFYDSENGIIKFEQVNISLEHLKRKIPFKINENDTAQEKENKKNEAIKMKNAFWIKDMWIKEREILDGTSEIVNIITVTGQAVAEGHPNWEEYGARAVIKNNKLIKKHGPIMGPLISILDLRSPQACFAYGKSLLDRINKKAASNANIRLVGNANIKAGYYCFIEDKNALFYIERVVHNYGVGGSYETEIELSYRREPILRVDNENCPNILSSVEKTKDSTINFMKIKEKLDKEGEMTFDNVLGNSLEELLKKTKDSLKNLGYIESEIKNVYTTESLKYHYFNGFIWEHTIETDFSQFAKYIFDTNTYIKQIEQDVSNIVSRFVPLVPRTN